MAVASGRYSLFHPGNKANLLSDFPELRKIASFMELDSPKKLLFVWYYACKASPAREILDESERIRYALRKAWGDRVPKEIEEPYTRKGWGTEVGSAIADMAAYEPELRIRLKAVCKQHIEILENLITQRPKDGEYDKMQDYLKMVQVSLATVQQFMPLAEGKALGVTEGDAGVEFDDTALFEAAMNSSN